MSTVPILLYHSVDDHPLGGFGPFTVSPDQFAGHLDRLQELGFTAITLAELMRRRTHQLPLSERTVAITFDDGFADFARHAWPALRRRGLLASLFVTAGTVGGRSEWLASIGAEDTHMLAPGQLLELAAEGCDIGAHSLTHPELDCLPRGAASREIRDSKEMLEQLLTQPVDSFAYPHGYHDREVKQLVTAAGFTSAAAVRNALSPHDDDPFALARVTVMADTDESRIEEIVLGRRIRTAKRREKLSTAGWRRIRRARHGRRSTSRLGQPSGLVAR